MKHVAVIGAGIIGAASAYFLAKAGCRVTVIDREGPGGVATRASFGWLNASFFVNEAHFHLRHAAMRAHRDLSVDFPNHYDWSGCLWFEAEGAAAKSYGEKLSSLGYRVDVPTPSERHARWPKLPPLNHALFFPDEGAIDTPALAKALLAASGAAAMYGVQAVSLRHEGGKVMGVETSKGPLIADDVVLCTGVGTPDLLRDLDLPLPLLLRPGVMVRTRPVDLIMPTLLCGPMGEARQLADGAVLVPTSPGHQGDETELLAESPDTLSRIALDRLERVFPGISFQADSVLAANRPVPADGLPVLSRASDGLIVAVMHSGATLAALAGQAVADLVSGAPTDALWAPYDLRRFAK